jgi:hypothetical protein
MANELKQEPDWSERLLVERLRKSCPNCSNTLLYNQLIYDLGFRRCLWCNSRIETYLPNIADYLLIAAALSGLMTENPVWKVVSGVCAVAWWFRRFRPRRLPT